MVEYRNIIVICLDSVRKDFFDEFSNLIRKRSDISLERCRAASSWSTPSHASMISGKLPSEHGIHTYNRHFRDLSKDETIFGDLDEHTTLAVSSNVFAGPTFGFDDYFDAFEVATSTTRLKGLSPEKYLNNIDISDPRLFISYLTDAIQSGHTINSILNAGIGGINLLTSPSSVVPKLFDKGTKSVLRRSKQQIRSCNEPFFSFCNIMEGHIPHEPIRGYNKSFYPDITNDWTSEKYSTWELCTRDRSDYWEKREQLYSAVIDYMDRNVSKYIDYINSLTDYETTIIITSDHGENHGRKSEEGMANHVSSLSEGLIHVPFEIFNPPSESEAVLESMQNMPTSHLQMRDIIKAIANRTEVAGVTSDYVVAAELVGRAESKEPPSRKDYWNRAQRCCIKHQQKILWDSQGRSFQYELDPSSSSWQSEPSGIDSIPNWARNQFSTEIEEYKMHAQKYEETVRLDETTTNQLRTLGYLE